jgi:hypothetical protein
MWRALHHDDWHGDAEYILGHGNSLLGIKQVDKDSGMTSLIVIRHTVPGSDQN